MGNTLFINSLANHQLLIDVMVKSRDKIGICNISTTELAASTNHSQTWVVQAIKRINSEDNCITCLGPGKYTVSYEDLSKRGVFNYILTLYLKHIAIQISFS